MKEKIKAVIADQLGIKVEEIKDDSNIVDELGADSLDVVELLMTLEDEYNISIPDEKVPEMTTVNAIVKIIEESK